jgi:hypothetical protein
MPIPTPIPNESENEFMSRCIEFVINEGTPEAQAIAICTRQWEENKMIECKSLNKSFATKKEMFKELVANKKILIAQKKAEMKRADGIMHYKVNDKLATKADISQIDLTNTNALNVKAIINTTNIMDSHDDVHIPGLWTKSLQENKNIMHLQEHNMSFKNIISSNEDLHAYTKFYNWTDLGYDFQGQTQALEFDSNVKKTRNQYMFEQYANNYVTNHSVGMRYVKIFLAVNDPDYPEEFEVWERYINSVVNADLANEKGYFYAVTEAKIIEGSAVPLGSNNITPTRSVTPKEETELEKQIKELKEIINNIKEPQKEPVTSTQIDSTQKGIDFLENVIINLNK